MGKSKSTNEKPLNIRLDPRRKKEIKKLLSERYKISENKKLIIFLSLYFDCESTAIKYVLYYKLDKKIKISGSYESLNFKDIEKAATYFDLKLKDGLIKEIFEGSDGIRGNKTPRQLRNKITHTKSTKDIEEVEQRFEELIKLMQVWIDRANDSTNKP